MFLIMDLDIQYLFYLLSSNHFLSIMKEITGGDKLTARKLFGDVFEFKPQFKLVLCCNDYKNECILGDIKKQTLKDILKSDIIKQVNGEIESPDDFILEMITPGPFVLFLIVNPGLLIAAALLAVVAWAGENAIKKFKGLSHQNDELKKNFKS